MTAAFNGSGGALRWLLDRQLISLRSRVYPRKGRPSVATATQLHRGVVHGRGLGFMQALARGPVRCEVWEMRRPGRDLRIEEAASHADAPPRIAEKFVF